MNDQQFIGGVSEREFALSRWFISHRLVIVQTAIGFLFVLNALLWGYTIYGLLDYYLISAPRYQAMIEQLTISSYDMAAYKSSHQPQELTFDNPQVLTGVAGRYDFFVNVKNPNDLWAAEISYHFVGAGNYEGQKLQTFVLPLSEKPLVDLAVSSNSLPRNVGLVIDELSWQRAAGYEVYRNQVLQVEISDLTQVDSQTAGLGSPNLSQTRFTAKNLSAYDYWSIGWYALLYRGGQLVGVNYLRDDEFLSGQTKNFTINWFNTLGSVTNLKVIPDINILDQDVFRLPAADSGELK